MNNPVFCFVVVSAVYKQPNLIVWH